MLQRYIIMFVLVMTMVKTNGRAQHYYFYDNRVDLRESNDKLLVTARPDASDEMAAQFRQRLEADQDFDVVSPGVGGYFVLRQKAGSTISKQEAVNRYLADETVVYAAYVYEGEQGSFIGIANDLLVYPKEGVSLDNIVSVATPYGLLSAKQTSFNANIYHLYFAKGGAMSTLEIANALFESGQFKFAEPNFFKSHKGDAPLNSSGCSTPSVNDALFGTQWGVYNNGVSGTTWNDVDVCHAWDYTKGAGITVAVVDDGIDTRHQDLINNVVPGYDAVPYGTWCGWTCAPVYLTDPGCASNLSNHGTQCAGIIGAEQNNSIGISGISPEVNIMPVRIYYFNAIFGAYETNAAWEAAGLAFAWQNADVLSNSWSYPPPGYSATTDTELDNALAFGRGGMGCVVVFSTGNADASAINWPSSKPGMIAVGAMSMCEERKNPASCDGETWWGSNYGYGPGGIPGTMGDFLSVVAPGVGVQTTHPWTNVYNAGFNGTSAACPHVSGAAALILAANPCMTTTEVKNLIEQTADKINTSVYAYATAQPNGAWDPEVGYGRVNIGQAVTFAYNMYRQDETESSAVKVYESSHHLYAGENVTALKSAGKYTINGTANITFMAANAITLDEGFMADAGSSVFLADLGTPCSVTSQHYKPTPQAEKTLASYKKSAGNIAGIRLQPNPNAGSFEMEIPAEGSYELRLLNMLGSVVYEAKLQGSRKHAIELDNSLPAGNYTLQVTGKDVRHVEKVVIAK